MGGDMHTEHGGAQAEHPLAVLAHELRNVVGSITSCLEILRVHGRNHPTSPQARRTIQRQAAQLLHLADHLLTATAAPDAEPPPQQQQAPRSEVRRVLVVDDDVEAANSIATLLRLWEHEVLVTYDGRTALSSAADFKPDVCLLDIWMPGMNGYQVAENMRRDPNVGKPLLVAMTGYDQYGDRRLAREAGFDHHLFKPVEIGPLREILALPHRP